MGTVILVIATPSYVRKIEVYSQNLSFLDMYANRAALKAMSLKGPGASYYSTGLKMTNCTAGRVTVNKGNVAGTNIERDSIFEDNTAVDRAVLYSQGWMVGTYINITFINSKWPVSQPQVGSLRFDAPSLGDI